MTAAQMQLRDTVGATGPLDRLYVLLPTLACYYAVLISPLLLLAFPADDATNEVTGRIEHRVFWIMLSTLTVTLTIMHRERFRYIQVPLTLYFVLMYLVLAGASATWALEPAISSKRFALQLLVVTCAILPPLLTANRELILWDLFLCLSLGALLNLAFLVLRPATELGHAGLFGQKNTLGEFAAVALGFALYGMMTFSPWKRLWATLQAVVSILLLVASQSKSSFGLAVLCPMAAGSIILVCLAFRTTPATILGLLTALVVALYAIFSDAFHFQFSDVSLALFGDTTFTGRTSIWSFATEMFASRPVFGHGYQSFWLIGPDAPSLATGPGWVKTMPHAHNGYLDTGLETGSVGLAILFGLIACSLIAIGRSVHRHPAAAWLALSLVLFMIAHNLFESSWIRAFSIQWLLFLVVTTAIASRSVEPLVQAKKR